jgi:hypothetical protein
VNNRKPTNKGWRLSNRLTNQPEIGNPINEQTGKMNKKFPSCASFISKAAFKVGIREAQEEKQNPEIKNKTLKADRFCSLVNIVFF